MANLLISDVRGLMSKYTLMVEADSINEDLFCSLCHNLMMGAHLTHCGCRYCHRCINEYLADGEKYCSGGKDECQEECLILGKNVSTCPMLDKKISNARVHCPKESCPCITKLKEMESHLQICDQRFTECPYMMIGCDTEGAPNSKIIAHLNNDRLVHSKLLIELVNNLKDELSALREVHCNEKIDNAKFKSTLETEIKRLNDELERSKNMMTITQPIVKLYIVDRFSERKVSAERFISPHFFSHTNGYKLLLLVVFPRSSSGTHSSVYILILKSEINDALPWPCRHTFTLSIINQRTGEAHKSMSFNYSTAADNFKVPPTDVLAGGFVCGDFLSHADLQSVNGLVENDKVIIRCIVSDIA